MAVSIKINVTGFSPLQKNFGDKRKVEKVLKRAFGRALSKIEGEAKKRTPVDTGFLKSSIGAVVGNIDATPGYQFIKKLKAGIGTNVVYAIFVHEGHSRHTVGERLYMEKGAKASLPFIRRTMEKAMMELGDELVKK